MIDFVKVGQKITGYRKKHGMTQDELAAQLYVSRQALSKWELGVGAPSIDSLLAICQIFNIPFEDLLCLNDNRVMDVDPDNVFKGQDRLYVIQQIIQGHLRVDLPDIFYQFSPYERMMVLKAIKDERIPCNLHDLYAKCTLSEQRYLQDLIPEGGVNQ